jgi:hypothetical protein
MLNVDNLDIIRGIVTKEKLCNYYNLTGYCFLLFS